MSSRELDGVPVTEVGSEVVVLRIRVTGGF